MIDDASRNGQKHTLGTAAKATGKSRSTILRAVKSGKLSYDRDVHGQYQIDQSELDRVYPKHVANQSNDASRNQEKNAYETVVLKRELEMSRELAEERKRTIEDLRDRLDKAEDERNKEAEERRVLSMRLLEDRRPAGFWDRLRGKD